MTGGFFPPVRSLEEWREWNYLSNVFQLMFQRVALAFSHYFWVQGRKIRNGWGLYHLCLSFPIGKKKALPNIPLPDFHLHLIGLFPYDIYYTSPVSSHIPHIITHYRITQSMTTSSCGGSLIVKHCQFYGHCSNFAVLPFMQCCYTGNVLHMIRMSPQWCYILPQRDYPKVDT